MTTQLSQIPVPQASDFDEKKKPFLVLNYVLPPDAPTEGQELLERWFGAVTPIYH